MPEAEPLTALFITYDGLTDPLGQSQILPYILGLRQRGYGFHVLSCEKPARLATGGDETGRLLNSHGIGWTPLTYTSRPPVISTMYDIARMWRAAARIASDVQVSLIHCRSYVPSVVGVRMARRLGVPFVFDMRGFWPDEKVEAGAWRLSNPAFRAVYRFFKREEDLFLRSAAEVVVLTDAAKDALTGSGRVAAEVITVVPCSVDFELFHVPSPEERMAARRQLGFDADDYVAAYVGSLGTWYMLDEMLGFFAALRELRGPATRLLVVTPDSAALVSESAERHGLSAADVRVMSSPRKQIPDLLAAADAGLSFVRATPSKVASSPTKIGEYLAMGLPVVANAGIGDTDAIMQAVNGGVLLHGFTAAELSEGASRLLALTRATAAPRRERARQWFSLAEAVSRYATLYERALRSAT